MDEPREASHLRLVCDSASTGLIRGSGGSRASGSVGTSRPPKLEVVRHREGSESSAVAGVQVGAGGGVQLRLFSDVASAGPSLLGFFHMYHAHGDSFAGLLAQIRPTWIFDLRPVPAFDLVRLDRRRAFRLFEQYGTAYCDSNVCFELWDRSDPRIASGELAEAFSRYATGPDRPGLKGPIIFLVDDSSVISTAIEAFPRVLRPVPRRGWQVHIFDHRALQHV